MISKKCMYIFLIFSMIVGTNSAIYAESSAPPTYEQRVNKTRENENERDEYDTNDSNDYEEKISRPEIDNSKYEVIDTDERPKRPTVNTGNNIDSDDYESISVSENEKDIRGSENSRPERPNVNAENEMNYIKQDLLGISMANAEQNNNAISLSVGTKVCLDGNIMNLQTEPLSINDCTMVPLRSVFEAMGKKVTWLNDTQTILISGNGTNISMKINDLYAKVNNQSYKMQVAPMLHTVGTTSYTMVPLRFISENLGYVVLWNQYTKTAHIYSNYYSIENNNKVYQVPYISYQTGDYAVVTSLAEAFGGFNESDSGTYLSGFLGVWNNNLNRTLYVKYDMRAGGDDGVNYGNIYDDSDSNDDIINEFGKNQVYMTKNNGLSYIKIEDLGMLRNYDLINNLNAYDQFDEKTAIKKIKNESYDNIKSYFDTHRIKVTWKSPYPVDVNNFTITAEPGGLLTTKEIWRTSCEITRSGNEYSAIIVVTSPKSEYVDGWIDITIKTKGHSKTTSAALNFLDNWKDTVIKVNEEQKQTLGGAGATVSQKCQSSIETANLALCKNLKSIDCTIFKGDYASTVEKVISKYMSEIFINAINNSNKTLTGGISEEEVVKEIAERIESGALNIKESGTMYGKSYYIDISGTCGDFMGTFLVFNVRCGNEQYTYSTVSSAEEIEAAVKSYIDEMEGLYDTAIQECIKSTISGTKELMGIDEVEKLLTAWASNKIAKGINKAIKETGITYEAMKQGYDFVTATKKCIDKCSIETEQADVKSSINSLKDFYKECLSLEVK